MFSVFCAFECCTPSHHACPCRRAGDFANNDEIYDAIDAASKEAQASHVDSRSGVRDGRDVHIITTTCRRLFGGLPVLLALLCCGLVQMAVEVITAMTCCSTYTGVRPPCLFLSCCSGEKLDLDKERKVRTPQEMAAEAAELRKLFQ